MYILRQNHSFTNRVESCFHWNLCHHLVYLFLLSGSIHKKSSQALILKLFEVSLMRDRPDNALENIQIINKVIPNCTEGSVLTFFFFFSPSFVTWGLRYGICFSTLFHPLYLGTNFCLQFGVIGNKNCGGLWTLQKDAAAGWDGWVEGDQWSGCLGVLMEGCLDVTEGMWGWAWFMDSNQHCSSNRSLLT